MSKQRSDSLVSTMETELRGRLDAEMKALEEYRAHLDRTVAEIAKAVPSVVPPSPSSTPPSVSSAPSNPPPRRSTLTPPAMPVAKRSTPELAPTFDLETTYASAIRSAPPPPVSASIPPVLPSVTGQWSMDADDLPVRRSRFGSLPTIAATASVVVATLALFLAAASRSEVPTAQASAAPRAASGAASCASEDAQPKALEMTDSRAEAPLTITPVAPLPPPVEQWPSRHSRRHREKAAEIAAASTDAPAAAAEDKSKSAAPTETKPAPAPQASTPSAPKSDIERATRTADLLRQQLGNAK